MFITDTHLLVRMEDARCSVLPRSLVSSVHIFHKVDVMEHVVAEGDHTHVRVVYRDSDGERAWTDIDASLLESSPTKLLRTIKEWQYGFWGAKERGRGGSQVKRIPPHTSYVQ